MRYLLSFLFSVCLFYPTVAQDILYEKNIDLRKGLKDKREALPVHNAQTGVTALFLVDNSTVSGIVFDNDTLAKELAGPRPENKYSQLMGYSISDGKYHVFFSNQNKTSLATTSFDFKSRKFNMNVSDFNYKKERFAGSASYRDRFFIFTVLKGTSTLKVYAFQDHKTYEVKTFSFEKTRFGVQPYFRLDDVIKQSEIVHIDNTVNNPLDVTRNPNKLYTVGDDLILTFDNVAQYTIMISIGLDTWDAKEGLFNHDQVACAGSAVNSNSYLYENALYQFSACPSAMAFSITSMEDGSVIKEERVRKEEEITFKNTAIVQQGGRSMFSPDERELGKTRQFLRKVANGSPAISAYKGKNGLQITLGSYEQLQTGGGFTPGFGPSVSFGAGVGAPMYAYNPVYNSYNQYTITLSVFFKALFDSKTLEHTPGPIADTAFDSIKNFTKKEDDGTLPVQTVFKTGDIYVLGYYDPQSDRYILRGFRD